MIDGAGRVSELLGRENRIVRLLQPLYGRALAAVYGRRGMPWRVNGEMFRIDPRVRRYIPHENEQALFAFLRDSIQSGDVVFDIGSFVGTYAMLAGRRVGRSGRVVAFEPSRWSFRVLERHIRMNGLADRIDARLAGVGAEPARRTLVEFEDEPYRNMIGQGAAGASVDIVTIDDVCDAIGRPPDWIRMDVQGLEFDVLRGARRTLASTTRGRLRIVAEMHPGQWPSYGVMPDAASAVLRELGLRARSLTGNRNPFEQDAHAILEPI